MDERRAVDELLFRLLEARIGQRPVVWPKRVHNFLMGAARATRQSSAALLEQMLAGEVPELLNGLISAATVGHTGFFRHPAQFEHLRGLLPQLARARGRRLELWSAGCSTGEEAYSLALCAAELCVSVRILATDVNPAAIQTARAGRYRASRASKLPNAASEWTAPPELKRMLRFEEASLVGPRPALGEGPFDLIFCRNVLIYFDRGTVTGLLERLVASLAPGGAIVVSPADAVLPLPACLEWAAPPGWLRLRATGAEPRASRGPRARASEMSRAPAKRTSMCNAEGPLQRAARLLAAGKAPEAEHLLASVLNQNPADLVAWYLLGEALTQRGEPVQARLAFLKASGLTPRDVDDAERGASRELPLLRPRSPGNEGET